MMKLKIFNIQKFSLHDGPGIRTVIFFKGCPLRCKWCANPESQRVNDELFYDAAKCVGCGVCQSVCEWGCIKVKGPGLAEISRGKCRLCFSCVANCPQQALTCEGESRTVEEIVDIAMQDMPFYQKSGGGVTLSGGEVLAQLNGAVELLAQLKKNGVHTTAETTGYASTAEFERLCEMLDLMLIDLKHHDESRHIAGTGVSNLPILHNMRKLAEGSKPFKVRIPVIPGYNDSIDDAKAFARILLEMGIYEADLLPFHQFGSNKYDFLQLDYDYKNARQLHDEDIAEFAGEMRKKGIEVNIGG